MPGGRSPFAIFCLLERLWHKNVRTLSEMVAAESVGAVRLLQHLEDSIKSGQTLVSTKGFASCRFTRKKVWIMTLKVQFADIWPLSGHFLVLLVLEMDFDNRQSLLLISHHCALSRL